MVSTISTIVDKNKILEVVNRKCLKINLLLNVKIFIIFFIKKFPKTNGVLYLDIKIVGRPMKSQFLQMITVDLSISLK